MILIKFKAFLAIMMVLAIIAIAADELIAQVRVVALNFVAIIIMMLLKKRHG